MRPNHISPHESLTAAEEMHAGLTILCIMAHSICLTSLCMIPRKLATEAKKRKISVEIPYLGEIVKLRKQK